MKMTSMFCAELSGTQGLLVFVKCGMTYCYKEKDFNRRLVHCWMRVLSNLKLVPLEGNKLAGEPCIGERLVKYESY